jgi:phosphatidylserine/phosphatidylglycerophosphate/cardiolipin synthase-like enzyme/uncharacterized membrane protein YdjX (TVP38/TMEM64 family)
MLAPTDRTPLAQPAHRLLEPGRNCWRLERADRVALLIDGEAYFRALHTAITRARHSILILAWEIDGNFRLLRDETSHWPSRLGELLRAVVKRRRHLRVHVLDWDFAMIHAPVAEFLPIYKSEWKTHRRIRFWMDDQHPLGGSHHQKVVVIDDAVAFSGGLDITRGRWDTPEHVCADPRRSDARGRLTFPYHDVQMAVSGPVAAALGDLARARWQRATRQSLHRPPGDDGDPWPPDLAPDLREVDVAISRTEPEYLGRDEVREVEILYLDAIAAARRSIYVENQFFTAGRIAAALAERLQEPDGPEVVVLQPLKTDSWLSQATMDVMRGRLMHRLRKADRYDRLRIFFPYHPRNELPTNLHAKVLVIDDELMRIGSANLNNRSMGLDTECDLAIEAAGRPDIARAIAAFRGRLLAEHLGTSPGEVDEALKRTGSLIRAIAALGNHERTLRPLEVPNPPDPKDLIYDEEMVDPERPVDVDDFVRRFIYVDEDRPPARRAIARWGLFLLAVLIAATAWRWTPLRETLDVDKLLAAATEMKRMPFTPLLVLGSYLIASLIAVPITLLILVTMIAFGALVGIVYSTAGVLLGAAAGYWLGYLLGRKTVRRLAGRRINDLSRRLARHGILAVTAVRLIPVAPFTVVNLVAGASHIRLLHYLLGTFFGLLPGLAAIALFTDRIAATLESPSILSIGSLIVVLALITLATIALTRWLGRKSSREPTRA